MKINYILGLLIGLTFLSCSPTITTSKKQYQITEKSKLKTAWKFNTKEWTLENQTFNGNGSPEHWAAITSKKDLPENYEITFEINLISGNLFEVMLNFENQNYIRTYLYNIDQNIVIGKGNYDKNSDEYGKRGGPTILKKPFDFSSNVWHRVKIKMQNKQLQFIVDDSTSLDCSLEKYSLSQKGKIGFLTNGKVQFKNLIIKTL
ncbi:family 16 glycoside hydrolase [Flavobacterium hungaricum]|uniref:DUF1080 domain-containing protein n=1 Tax=Flavobacterium hungaricum TaxID=2082725 RepID=A0ABR9TFD6_9FLAO|nr:family 16 glycoside hydrolase [Flavobacterium hungaricum]MBE8724055.1 DUF1080 domain-containing protein [Flavobacterium hungaricum]